MELEAEFLRQDPPNSTMTPISLAISIARLNSRIRSNGLSARELWTQRDQYTQSQFPIDNDNENYLFNIIIIRQYYYI